MISLYNVQYGKTISKFIESSQAFLESNSPHQVIPVVDLQKAS